MTFVEGDAAALAIIESWGWDHADPRFEFYVPVMISVSDAVNRLAMEGHADPAGAVLSLLASGKLEATGSHRFKAYRNGHFQREGVGPIPVCRWQVLQANMENEGAFRKTEVTLHLIGGDDFATKENSAEWHWHDDWFSTAQVSGGDWLDQGYFEETYSASDIEVRPADREAASLTSSPGLGGVEPNKGGAPAKYDWERAVAAVVFQWADEGSWQPALQADVKKRLAEWFAERDQYPSDSMLKERARWLFEEFRQRAPEADNLAA
jgi:hypothetical protein